jgi:hypothetical protein
MDLRIEHIYQEEMKGDNSFKERPTGLEMLFGASYKHNAELRETWRRGIKHGIEIGLRRASLEGQRIELNNNTPEGKNKEFLERVYQLSDEYKCAIQYHPELGMVVVDRNYQFN